jgi:hypothetical protein
VGQVWEIGWLNDGDFWAIDILRDICRDTAMPIGVNLRLNSFHTMAYIQVSIPLNPRHLLDLGVPQDRSVSP